MVASTLLKSTLFVSVMLYVLVAGVRWGTWLALARTMTDYDADTFLDDGKHMIDNLATVALLLMIGVLVVTLAIEVPIDDQIKAWTTATPPADWQAIRSRWEAFHTVRTFLSLGAVAAAVGGALTLRPAALARRRAA